MLPFNTHERQSEAFSAVCLSGGGTGPWGRADLTRAAERRFSLLLSDTASSVPYPSGWQEDLGFLKVTSSKDVPVFDIL